MSNDFNLLSLHQLEDKHPRSWICIKGTDLSTTVRNLTKEIISTRKWTNNFLYTRIADELGCAVNTVANKFSLPNQYYPIAILSEMLRLNKRKAIYERELEKNTQYLKVNSASAKPIKAVRVLTNELASIVGAFMADGSLSAQTTFEANNEADAKIISATLIKSGIKHSNGVSRTRDRFYVSIQVNPTNYTALRNIVCGTLRSYASQTHNSIELTDEYEDSVRAFGRWMGHVFGISSRSLKKRGNAWQIIFSNKIIARYFMSLFKIIPGPKTFTANEPKPIRASGLETRKAFARGVLMFDGCVTKNRTVALSVKSEKLRDSIRDIWHRDGVNFGVSQNKKRGEWTLFSTKQNTLEKLLAYFQENTQKHKLLRWLTGDKTVNPILKWSGTISADKILKVISLAKSCDSCFLQTYFKCSHTTIRDYLKMLVTRGQITLSRHPRHMSHNVSEDTSILLEKDFHQHLFRAVKTTFVKYKKCASFLGVGGGTLSAWYLRKNRIPIYILDKLGPAIGIKAEKILENSIEVDHEIAEVAMQT
jgi:transposase-like protein